MPGINISKEAFQNGDSDFKAEALFDGIVGLNNTVQTYIDKHDKLHDKLHERVDILEKWKWRVTGGLAVLAAVFTALWGLIFGK